MHKCKTTGTAVSKLVSWCEERIMPSVSSLLVSEEVLGPVNDFVFDA